MSSQSEEVNAGRRSKRMSRVFNRGSISNPNVPLGQLLSLILPLSFKTGIDINQQQLINIFCKQHQFMNQKHYRQLNSMCDTLPGTTSNQMIISMLLIASRSGVVSIGVYFVYCLPSVVVVVIGNYVIGQVYKEEVATVVKMFVIGIEAASAAIPLRAIIIQWNFQRKIFLNIIFISTAIVFYIYRNKQIIYLSLAISAILSMYVQYDQAKPMSYAQKNIMRSLHSRIYGVGALLLLLILFFTLYISSSLITNVQELSEGCLYYINGCLQLGNSYILLPLFSINDPIYLPLSLFLPLSLPLYPLWRLLDQYPVYTALAIYFLYFLPSVLCIFWILPVWYKYRDKQAILRLRRGMQASSMGVVLGFIGVYLQNIGSTDIYLPAFVFISCYIYLHVYRLNVSLVILIGGLLGIIRKWSVQFYNRGQLPTY